MNKTNKTRIIYCALYLVILVAVELLRGPNIRWLPNSRILDIAMDVLFVVFGILVAKTYDKKPNQD